MVNQALDYRSIIESQSYHNFVSKRGSSIILLPVILSCLGIQAVSYTGDNLTTEVNNSQYYRAQRISSFFKDKILSFHSMQHTRNLIYRFGCVAAQVSGDVESPL